MDTFRGRHSARIEGEFVVLLIGMRINKPWKVHRWLPVFTAMAKMTRELSRDPESGFLGSRPGVRMSVQYWRSFEHLERFARDPGASHLAAWRAFNQEVGGSGDVGVWHETYRVRAGEYEAVYANMPRAGLASAAEHVPVGSASTAARRLGVRSADEPPVAGY